MSELLSLKTGNDTHTLVTPTRKRETLPSSLAFHDYRKGNAFFEVGESSLSLKKGKDAYTVLSCASPQRTRDTHPSCLRCHEYLKEMTFAR